MVLDITRMSAMYSWTNLQNMELVIYMVFISKPDFGKSTNTFCTILVKFTFHIMYLEIGKLEFINLTRIPNLWMKLPTQKIDIA